MEQSWLVPFSPRREHTAANVSEPWPHTVPDVLSTAGATAFPSPAPAPSPLLSLPTDSDRARPCSSDEICRISPGPVPRSREELLPPALSPLSCSDGDWSREARVQLGYQARTETTMIGQSSGWHGGARGQEQSTNHGHGRPRPGILRRRRFSSIFNFSSLWDQASNELRLDWPR